MLLILIFMCRKIAGMMAVLGMMGWIYHLPWPWMFLLCTIKPSFLGNGSVYRQNIGTASVSEQSSRAFSGCCWVKTQMPYIGMIEKKKRGRLLCTCKESDLAKDYTHRQNISFICLWTAFVWRLLFLLETKYISHSSHLYIAVNWRVRLRFVLLYG